MNLCTNAEYAMRETGGVLTVRLDALRLPADDFPMPSELRAGSYVRLTVQDTGQGIDPDILDHIFEPFFTTKHRGEGTGMGLAVVHGIIASHGGAITVHSVPGHGTTFTVYLPQREALPGVAILTAADVPSGHERILFVDDEVALVNLGQALLTRLGYAVSGYTSSLEALHAFYEAPQRFDLVITDYTMPHLTGAGLAHALRCIRPDIPIILCTGFSHTMTAEKAQGLGINAFCLKPLSSQGLGQTIRHVLDAPAVRQA
jgi:CheY-like chemotaxis protein